MQKFWKNVRDLIPRSLKDILLRHIEQFRYRGLTRQKIFQKIYEEAAWGKSNAQTDPYCSGSGSGDGPIVNAYVEAIKAFFQETQGTLDAVDVGCGDFNVGSKIRGEFRKYVACDIVKPLIDFNRKKYKDFKVEFMVLDAVTDQIPAGSVLFLRQVLQHISNQEIIEILAKVRHEFAYLIVTEHLPSDAEFPHNKEKPTGPGIRLDQRSGVVLTSAPFFLECKVESTICEVPDTKGIVRTIVYKL